MYSKPDQVDITKFAKKEVKRSVAFRNSKRREVNAKWMAKMLREYKKKLLTVLPKNPRDKNSQDVSVFKGLPIMACKTRGALKIINGEEFEVVDMIDGNVFISNPYHKESIAIPQNDFTNIFYPAFCVSVHKSQGSTYDHPYTIYEWDKMDNRLKYVALSRATKKEHVNIYQ